jgi:transcriptional regulator with XRE-family HTH domain
MYEKFVRDKITALRLKKGVSEYEMSYALGRSRGYVYNISSGRSLPPLQEFFNICEYFGITPVEFFDDETKHPELIKKALEGLIQLDETDLITILSVINRLTKK